MTNQVLDLSERPARLSVRNCLLAIQFEGGKRAEKQDSDGGSEPAKVYRCERAGNPGEVTIPLADIAVLIVSHPQVSFSHAVLSGLAEAGGVFVTCNEKHMPVAMLLPLAVHSLQTERLAAQAGAALPLKKRLWQEIVRAKIRAQGRLLEEKTGNDRGLGAMAVRVRSGDVGNLEAQAARIYWQNLIGGNGFRRDPDAGGPNACLNYGYAVLRAIVARAICGAGLHPSLGVHHHNRYDTFCLADDLMEPFRPIVDREVARLTDLPGADFPLDRESKRALLKRLLGRFSNEEESRTLFDWIGRSASSLAGVIEGRCERLELPDVTIDGE
ncbi:MAG TPA: type II CRISPR-associated endonuclease Cas1 [Candidatus Aquilonibacter sp.]|nr:type II CRISPR-associated endonuclease Cas1 [Candidatus Aquilonibacter sp.]